MQADFLVRVLAKERPVELADAYETAKASGKAWRKRIEASLMRMRETRALLDAL